MANRQLVMLNCKASHKTPLVRVKADMTHISVAGVGQGDEVWLQIEGVSPIKMQSGLTPFPHDKQARQFLIEKIAGSNPEPTTIEVLRGS